MKGLDGIRRIVSRVANAIVPEQHGEEADSLGQRGRLLLLVLLLSALNVGWTAVFQWRLGNTTFSMAALGTLALAIAIVLALRAGWPIRWLTTATVALIYGVTVAVCVGTGGQWAGGYAFLIIVPAISVLLVSPRSGVVWAVVTVATLIALSTWPGSGQNGGFLIAQIQPEDALAAAFRTAALLTIAVSAVACFYAASSQKANAALGRSVELYQAGERRFRAIAENAYDLIVELDATGRILHASPGFDEVLGLSARAARGRHFLHGVHPDDRDLARAAWQDLLAKGARRVEPLRFRGGNGRTRLLEVSMRSYGGAPGEEWATRVVAVARDVTERIEREKLIRHQQKLVAAGTMAAGIAHQLNNPISSILASAQYTERFRFGPEYPEVAAESLGVIEEEAQRCGRIARSMLAYARAEPTERWLEPIDATVIRAARAIEIQEGGLTSEVVLSLSPERLLVFMSPIEIEEALINLVRNALQHEARVVVVGTSANDRGGVEITVSDDGRGIGAEIEDDLFRPFFTTHPESGSGLGLSVAREIVEAHSGTLQLVESTPDGTVFRVELPRSLPS